jgi:hypothetical protein
MSYLFHRLYNLTLINIYSLSDNFASCVYRRNCKPVEVQTELSDSTLTDPATPAYEPVLSQTRDMTIKSAGAMPSVEPPPEDKIYYEYYEQSDEVTFQRNVAYETAVIKTEN